MIKQINDVTWIDPKDVSTLKTVSCPEWNPDKTEVMGITVWTDVILKSGSLISVEGMEAERVHKKLWRHRGSDGTEEGILQKNSRRET